MAVRVVIADDHEMVREGLCLFLGENPDIEIVGQASTGAQTVALCEALRPDVLLLDRVFPDTDGAEITRIVRAQRSPPAVVVLTSLADEAEIRAVISAGAIGFLFKDTPRGALVDAIVGASRGRPTLHPLAQSALIRSPAAASHPHESLTPRERDILAAIGAGKSNKEIAAALGLTLGTVKGYVSAVFVKLDVADRTQAALYAARHGIG